MWAIYALLSAFFTATSDPIAKKALARGSDEYVVGWLAVVFSLPILWVYCSISGGGVILTPELLGFIAIAMPLEAAATILYYKALKATDISLSVPFLALTPVFVIVMAYILLGEKVHTSGAIGIVLIAIGVYSLNIKEARHGFTTPVRAMFMNKGSFYMMLVAIIFSVTATISKKVMVLSSPQAAPLVYNLSAALAIAPVIACRSLTKRGAFGRMGKDAFFYISMGLCAALSSILLFKSMHIVNTAYAIAIKRMSLMMSVMYGWLLFRERDIHIRMASTVCMFAGVTLVLIK